MIKQGTHDKITEHGKIALADTYLLKDETNAGLFSRVATAYCDNQEHAQRIYNYMHDMWFMPATPILANGGLTAQNTLPISCFLNEVQDTLSSVLGTRNENGFLSTSGGGIGTHWSNVRELGAKVGTRGEALGVIPQMMVQDAMTLADSQSNIRRGSAAAYLDISHPEIEEFIDMRRPTGGDPNRKCLNLHHGICISDAFMNAVQEGKPWNLISPANGEVTKIVSPRDLWIKILSARVETGEPYLLYIDNVNKDLPPVYKANGLTVKTSNLCSEIMLHTGEDHLKKERTAVCCLSSLNIEYYEEWKDNPMFIEDVMRFLDNVLEDFIRRAPDSMARAKYSATRERSVGLGVMGFHSFLQSKNTPIEGVAAKSWNIQIFKYIQEKVALANILLANERGACPDAKDVGLNLRFSNTMAIAPTASISIICGGTSPCIEPSAANSFTHKTRSGSFVTRNKYLKNLLQSKGKDTDLVWHSIVMNEGSVQSLDCLTPHEKDVFKTAMEIDQMWLIDHAADRQKFIDQGQSLNVFIPANVSKKVLHDIHFQAWKKGVKSLYYCRSASIQRAEKSNVVMADELPTTGVGGLKNVDECLSCQ